MRQFVLIGLILVIVIVGVAVLAPTRREEIVTQECVQLTRALVCDVVTPGGVPCVLVMRRVQEGGIGVSCDWGPSP